MKVIWKYELTITDEQTIDTREGAELLCVQIQNGTPHLWALADDEQKLKPKTIYMYGTGNPISEKLLHIKYIGTFQQPILAGFPPRGSLVWHVFEKI